MPDPPKHAGNSNGVKALVALTAVAAVGFFAFADKGDDDKKKSTNASNSQSVSDGGTNSAAAAGTSVRDGKFEFRVVNSRRADVAGDPTNQFMTVPAQGEFFIVTLSITNIGSEPQSFFGQNQKLIDSSGNEYAPNSSADMWMNSGTGDINPGNAIRAELAFDVPPGTPARELELHDSMLSGGARVALGGPAASG